jgi:hypothetical protein
MGNGFTWSKNVTRTTASVIELITGMESKVESIFGDQSTKVGNEQMLYTTYVRTSSRSGVGGRVYCARTSSAASCADAATASACSRELATPKTVIVVPPANNASRVRPDNGRVVVRAPLRCLEPWLRKKDLWVVTREKIPKGGRGGMSGPHRLPHRTVQEAKRVKVKVSPRPPRPCLSLLARMQLIAATARAPGA